MVTFPAQIGKEDIMIKSDVIDSDLPLLLSKSAMKKAMSKLIFQMMLLICLIKKLTLSLQLVDIIQYQSAKQVN